MQHSSTNSKLILFDETMGERELSERLSVIEWNYRAGKIVRHDFPLGELFAKRWGKLRPRSAISVK
jgi:hypothetical protein